MNTTENNKIISEFMGFDFTRFSNDGVIEPNYGTFFKSVNSTFTLEELQFNLDWNWLMEVVEKIENMGVVIVIGRMFCDIKYQDIFNKDLNFEIRISSGVKINAVNGAIVELIKWYNQQNTK